MARKRRWSRSPSTSSYPDHSSGGGSRRRRPSLSPPPAPFVRGRGFPQHARSPPDRRRSPERERTPPWSSSSESDYESESDDDCWPLIETPPWSSSSSSSASESDDSGRRSYLRRSPSPVSHDRWYRRRSLRRTPSLSPRNRKRSPSPMSPRLRRSPSPVYTRRRRRRHDRKNKKSLYLIFPYGHGDHSGYAVHRVDVASSRGGISVTGEELTGPSIARFRAAPGMDFIKVGSKVVGVTGKDGGARYAGSVIIDAASWEVSAVGPPPSSVKYGIVELDGKIYNVDMFCEDPRLEVLDPARRVGGAGGSGGEAWSPLPRPPFRSRVVSLAVYRCSYRPGLLLSTEDHESYLFDTGLAAWVKLRGEPLPFVDRAVRADGYPYLTASPPEAADAGGLLRAHDIAVVDDGFTADDPPSLRCDTYRVHDPIPVVTPAAATGGAATTRTVYIGRGRFCAVRAGGGGDGDRVVVTVTVFKVLDSDMPWGRRRRKRRMDARWVASEFEAALCCASHHGDRRRQICRLNLWSRTFVVGDGGVRRPRGPYLAGALWM